MTARLLLMAIVAALGVNSGALAASQDNAGAPVFNHWCAPCHAPGDRHPGTVALAAKYHGEKPGELERRQDLTPDLVRYFVRHGVSVMPSFRKTEITDAELDALGAYLSSSKAAASK